MAVNIFEMKRKLTKTSMMNTYAISLMRTFLIFQDNNFELFSYPISVISWVRILVQVTIYRRLLIGRDGHLDQS